MMAIFCFDLRFPGIGMQHSINQHPYTLVVVSKGKTTKVVHGTDRAGLEVHAPFVYVLHGTQDSVSGVQQSKGNKQMALFIGLELADMADYIERHVVESYGPLEVVKRWDCSTLQRDEKGHLLVGKERNRSVGSSGKPIVFKSFLVIEFIDFYPWSISSA